MASATPAIAPGCRKKSCNVLIQGFAFEPTPLKIKVGMTVNWINLDPDIHNIRSRAVGLLVSGGLPTSGTYSHTFTEVGEFAYICSIHPDMGGTITVTR
jgi:plastocyanin